MNRLLCLLALTSLSACFAETSSPECIVDSDCPGTSICRARMCEMRTIEECREGCRGYCDTTSGECLSCTADSDCEGNLCIAGQCYVACVDSAECGEGEVCHRGMCGASCDVGDDLCSDIINGAIVEVTQGRELLPGFARFGCQLSAALYVDPFCDGRLPNTTSGSSPIVCDACLVRSGGCGEGQECIQGDCTCDAESDCPDGKACVDGFCAPCGADSECECDEYCSAGECLPVCAADEECPDGFVCADGRCAGCRSDDDCAAGFFCYEDGCIEPCGVGTTMCSETGRSVFCTLFSPIDELSVTRCE